VASEAAASRLAENLRGAALVPATMLVGAMRFGIVRCPEGNGPLAFCRERRPERTGRG
jgi:hypothetical protein